MAPVLSKTNDDYVNMMENGEMNRGFYCGEDGVAYGDRNYATVGVCVVTIATSWNAVEDDLDACLHLKLIALDEMLEEIEMPTVVALARVYYGEASASMRAKLLTRGLKCTHCRMPGSKVNQALSR
ncbi:hypothetical protein PI124_g23201 [Phytophthora idaei]|nr:hypothetical protein PI126_g23122 [Phytophthora idaei]KAG3231704.1 hypothetical protein PI124_g23201 [Phytophthora idaei]